MEILIIYEINIRAKRTYQKFNISRGRRLNFCNVLRMFHVVSTLYVYKITVVGSEISSAFR